MEVRVTASVGYLPSRVGLSLRTLKLIRLGWADVVPQRKSSLCYFIFCNNAVFSWKSTLTSVLAMSSAEAELIALCACAADVAYCRKLANELGFLQLRPTIIH